MPDSDTETAMPDSDAATILLERDGPIATIVLNRPEKLNALTRTMWARLAEVARSVAGEDAVRCVVLRGAGGKAFAPGNDISEFPAERSNVEQARAYGRVMHATIEALRDVPQPVVALIEGICVGGGLEIALLADIRVCGESSRFGVPVARLGLVMAYPEIAGLIERVGESTALEILLEGRVFGAEEALRKGLVSRVVPDDRVVAEAYATATRIAEGAPLAARWHKKFARRLREARPLTEAELDEGFACFGTEDFRIGYRAFLAKRRPDFVGR